MDKLGDLNVDPRVNCTLSEAELLQYGQVSLMLATESGVVLGHEQT
jgi:hypothetical protein